MRSVWYFGKYNLVVVDGEVRRDFKPYFYAIGGNRKEVFQMCRSVDPGCQVEEVELTPYAFSGVGYRPVSERVYRVSTSTPGDVPRVREKLMGRGIKVSQSYIVYGARASIDINAPRLEIPSEVPSKKIVAVDVEKVGKRVYVGIFDGTDHVWISYEGGTPSDEALMDIDYTIHDADYIVTFNGWGFDWRYIGATTRFTWCPRGSDSGCLPILDLFIFAESGFKASLGIGEEATSLYDVARQVGALPIPWDEAMKVKLMRRRISTMSEEELKRYNRLDTEITWRLGQRWVQTLEALSELTGISVPAMNQVAERASPGAVAEYVIHYKLTTRDGIVLADRERELDYGGEVKVMARAAGVFKSVAEYDFNMLYPTTYYYYRLDPIGVRECSDGHPVRVGGKIVRICMDGGPVYEVLARFYEARAVTKKLKKERPEIGEALDTAVKILANAAYGIFGKAGLGMVNEYLAAFIFEHTSKIFEDLWNRYRPIYGDTDSLYMPLNGKDPEKLLAEINSYVKSRYGEPFELKLEEVWDYVAIPPDESGRPLRKNYVKAKGEKVVPKGAQFKPRDLPRGLKPRYYQVIKMALTGEPPDAIVTILVKEAEAWLDSGDVDYLFAEYSTTWHGLGYTHEGALTSRLDNRKLAVLALLLTTEPRVKLIYRRGSITRIEESNGKRVAKELDPTEIIDVVFIPKSTRGRRKEYAVLAHGDKPMLVAFDYALRLSGAELTIEALRTSVRELKREEVLTLYRQYLIDVLEPILRIAKIAHRNITIALI